MQDFRVMFQYLDNEGHDRYEFTTVLADDQLDAEMTLTAMHAGDFGFSIVQSVVSSGAVTGFTDEDRDAAIAHAVALRKGHSRAD